MFNSEFSIPIRENRLLSPRMRIWEFRIEQNPEFLIPIRHSVFHSHEEGERGLNPLGLCIRGQAGQHFDEMRMLSAGENVLPAIGTQQAGFEIVPFLRRKPAAASLGKISCVIGGLSL